MLQLFEKLINEHGSSVILKERLTILKDEYAQIEKSKSELQSKNDALQSKLNHAQIHIQTLEGELASLKTGIFAKYVCDHCGNPNLKRTGSRPDPTFGDLGIKQLLFQCTACGKQSAFIETPP
jgi:DNA-directed RNA polymerase subunit RPC12/RpoP